MLEAEQDIYEICEKFTDLTAMEMDFLVKVSGELIKIAEKRDRDVFINCMCRNGKSTTVAYAHCENSVYLESTLGIFVDECDEPAIFRTYRTGKITKDVCAVSYTTTEGNLIIQEVYPIKYRNRFIGVLVIEQGVGKDSPFHIHGWVMPDIDKYSYLQNFDVIGDCINESVIVVNDMGRVVYRNMKAVNLYRYYGYRYDILDKNYADISIHGDLNVAPGMENAFHEQEIRCRDKFYSIKEYCYYKNEFYYLILITDTTRSKENEQSLILKSVALREAHHRIKNNLQTIYSLLDMQMRRVESSTLRGILREAMSRVLSISGSYESLLSSENGFSEIGLRTLIENVTNKINQVDRDKHIDINVEGEDFKIDADIATDIALVVNELIQNSFKHAFKDRERGSLLIKVRQKQIYAEVSIADDGKGFDSSNIKNSDNGLGIQIVKNLIEGKLKGNLKIDSDSNGTLIEFDFRTYRTE